MQLRNRDIELRFIGIFQLQHFVFAHQHQPAIPPDAVLFVYHGVADADFRQIAQAAVRHGGVLFAAAVDARTGNVLIQLGFGDDGKVQAAFGGVGAT